LLQSIDIHSSGFNRYTSVKIVSLVVAAVASALLALGQLESKTQVQEAVYSMTFVNSATSPDPDCTARVSDASNRILLTLGIDKTWALCQAAKASRERAGLDSSARSLHTRPSKGHR
jgi:hypothetical protein